MAWIESHQELGRHPKTRKLARILGVSVPTALGHLHLLWYWALDFAQDGDVTKYDADEIAEAALWEGDPDALLDALGKAGFLDSAEEERIIIHDWAEYAGKLIDRRKSDAERKRIARGSNGLPQPVRDMSDGRPVDVRTPSGVTVPNPTVPEREKAPIAASAAPSRAPALALVPDPAPKPEKRDPEPEKKPAKRAAARNPIWDALVDVMGFEPTTRPEVSNWGKCVKDLREAGATPEEIKIRTARYVKRYGREFLTVNAIPAHWSDPEITSSSSSPRNRASPAPQEPPQYLPASAFDPWKQSS